MRPAPALALAALTATLTLAACGSDEEQPTAGTAASTSPSGPSVSADLRGPADQALGSVTMSFTDGAVIDVRATGLPPGPHAFHLHKTGACEPKSPDPADPSKTGDFLSAGGHLAEEGQTHGNHIGDMPSLIVGADGTASLTTELGAVTMEDVLDADGTAVMVHAMPDNFANVPDRYAPQGVDDTTKKTGDAGARIACAPLSNQR